MPKSLLERTSDRPHIRSDTERFPLDIVKTSPSFLRQSQNKKKGGFFCRRSTKNTIMPRIAVLLVLSLLLAACGATERGARSGVTSDRIVVSKLSSPVTGLSAYELIDQYKSNWLRKRGQRSIKSPEPIRVYVDNTGSPYGTVSSLRRINAEDVATIQHFSPQEAQAQFGLGNASGAILVRTKSGRE